MPILWRKIWRDLTGSKLRTLLAALSMAAGLFAVGLSLGAREITRTRIRADINQTHPADLTFRGGAFGQATFDDTVEKRVRAEPGVADTEAELNVPLRWKRAGETEWQAGFFIARPDYTAQRLSRLELLAGAWPADRALGIERQSALYFGLEPGTSILVEAGSQTRRLTLTGLVRKPYVLPPLFGGPATFLVTPETLTWLTGLEGFNKLYIRLEPTASLAAATQQLNDRVERLGLQVNSASPTGVVGEFEIRDMQSQFDTMYLMLMGLGGLALVFSAFLIFNTQSALITQQIWQIGVMKVLGASFGDIARLYWLNAVIYGSLALLLAVGPAAFAAQRMADGLLDMTVNILPEPAGLTFSPGALLAQGLLALLAPVLAALVPVINGARLTPADAISLHGLGGKFGASWLDRVIGAIRGLPRPLALSLRNTFRHKARLSLTLLALTLGGVMFMVVTSTHASLNASLETILQALSPDVMIVLSASQRADPLIDAARAAPGVAAVEVWEQHSTDWVRPDGQRQQIVLWGTPPNSPMFHPVVTSGRGLQPADDQVILLDQTTARRNGVQPGDQVMLILAGQETTWQVAGLILNAMPGTGDCFVPYTALTRALGSGPRGNLIMVVATQPTAAAQAEAYTALEKIYQAQGIEIVSHRTAHEFREQSQMLFNTLSGLLLSMTVVAAVVGGVGLLGTFSLNVLEHRREIGVMRAIGGTGREIAGIFVSEGLCVGWLSWGLAVPLSYPSAYFFSRGLGLALFGAPLIRFEFAWAGALAWLVIVSGVAALASAWPALQAARLSVRETLAYE